MDSCVEELKILQTILLLVTASDIVQGKSLGKVRPLWNQLEVLCDAKPGSPPKPYSTVMYVCMYVRMYVCKCIYVCVYVCCMYMCMYVCMFVGR